MTEFPDWSPAPNIRDSIGLYELENQALDPDGLVLDAMRELAPWAGRSLVDLGCGTGFWLSQYAAEAAAVTGVEPDPELRRAATTRSEGVENVSVLAGSAEHMPFANASVDVVHARFAYFFGAGAEAGLQEVIRVLQPGGALVVIDNDYDHGEFADLLREATQGNAGFDPHAATEWWHKQRAQRVEVMSQWRFAAHADLAAVLRNEFRDGTADAWLSAHPGRTSLTYGYLLFAVTADSSRNNSANGR
jgi:ubiquinone/menaquinone biosynthesis C-methylase UbiE